MEWLIFAILSSFFNSFATIAEKNSLKTEHALQFNTVQTLLSFFMLIPFVFLVDFSVLTANFVIAVAIASFIGAVATLLLTKSTRHLELSVVSPLVILGPAFTSILAIFFLGEKLDTLQWVGIVVMLLGSYLLELDSFKHFLMPIKTSFKSKFVLFVLFGLLLFSICSILDKILVMKADFFTYLFIVHFFLSLYFVLLTCLKYSYKDIVIIFKDRKATVSIVGISFFVLLRRLFYIWAVSLGPVSIINPIKRSSQLITTFVGGKIFHEKNLLHKLISSVIMFLGLLLLLIF
ncbi:EamA family transporter [Candidatus Woesearchaeota archaeon]|nr:EamA family transporter [Candidatus Woesearchaeota archaeon]